VIATSGADGSVTREARNDSGNPTAAPIAVAITAICIVWASAGRVFGKNQ
jgi:hypothetical protein